MSKDEAAQRIRETGVLPVIRAASKEEAKALIEAIRAGGIDTIEVTMTVPGAIELIAELASDQEILIGAGTVLDTETASRCIDAGAKFIISPALNFETIEYCNNAGVVVMPGALTPTEVVNAWNAGADFVKVFPAGALGGASYLKSLKAPLPHIKLIPTGGVNLNNATDFIRAGAEAVGVGADLADVNAIREGDSDKITETARKLIEVVRSARA
jgi:2-dehydro-3-deoxyphosphogluconate aldolase/(4S)-4-hydroxy-2-oxoglutarate aldolase